MDLLFTAEVAVGVLVAILLTVVLTVIGRRRAISRGALITMAGLRTPSGEWRHGYARFGDESLEWFPLRSLSTRPSRRWPRRDLHLGHPEPLDSELGLDAPAVQVTGRLRDDEFTLGMHQSAYMALRSWVEGAPPESVSAVT